MKNHCKVNTIKWYLQQDIVLFFIVRSPDLFLIEDNGTKQGKKIIISKRHINCASFKKNESGILHKRKSLQS